MKKSTWHTLILAALVLVLAGCISTVEGGPSEPVVEAQAVQEATGAEQQPGEIPPDSVSSATPEGVGWMILLAGVRQNELWQSDFELWKDSTDSYRFVELEKKGETNLYGGFPLSSVVAIVDDADGGMPYVFQADNWAEGYDITLTAADGYSYTFSTLDASADQIYLVDNIDGEPVPPQIAGNITTKAWVRDLAEIELSLAPVSLAANDFEFELDINGETSTYTIPELEAMPIYVEDRGSYTNSYGNTFDAVWGGVKLVPLLEAFMEVTPDTAIRVIAMDGYEMSFGGDMLLDQADGDWILAFRENGEYMPEDPGYIRLVKVGPDNPNIPGHASARMIKRIVTEGEPFRDFELTIEGRDGVEVFDRQTLQSGVTTNRNRVTYYDRRADVDVPYMGISVWRLLERLDGYRAVTLEATDGFAVTLESAELAGNDDVILAMYTGPDDELLGPDEWPLRLAWDKDADLVPDGIKSVRNVVRIILVY
jgi:hypothetical protein